jgi:hypothetical protein
LSSPQQQDPVDQDAPRAVTGRNLNAHAASHLVVHLTMRPAAAGAHATHCLSASPTPSTSNPPYKGTFSSLHMSENVLTAALDCSRLHIYSYVNVAIAAWHDFCHLAMVLSRHLGPIVPQTDASAMTTRRKMHCPQCLSVAPWTDPSRVCILPTHWREICACSSRTTFDRRPWSELDLR